MASASHLQLVVAVVLLAASASAVEYTVGDGIGWAFGYNYSKWTAGKTFYTGDTLVFKYQRGDHNVYAVDEAGYSTCQIPNGATAMSSGNDVVTLTEQGTSWYICGILGHCGMNQKLAVTVLPAGASGSGSTGGNSALLPSPPGSPSGMGSSGSGSARPAVTRMLPMVAGVVAACILLAG